MSAITIESDLVHYEVLGRGRPVIFVHGWLGSWRYWVPTMQQLSMKYRTYALDLWGFGDSGKDPNKYGIKDQVLLLYNFFERLGIPKAALIGHSLGAAVCLSFARQYPERAHRMMLISTPLFDSGSLGDDAPNPALSTSSNLVVPPARPTETVITIQPPPSTALPAITPGAVPAATANTTTSTSTTATSGSVTVPPGTQPAQTPTPPAANAPAQPAAPQFSSTSDTIPRNPFRSRGESPEDILARLRAKNTSTVSQTPTSPAASGATPTTPPAANTPPIGPVAPIITPPPTNQPPASPPPSPPVAGGTGPLSPKPTAPVLPTVIATPILPTVTPNAPQTPAQVPPPMPIPVVTPSLPTTNVPSMPARLDMPNPLVGLLSGVKPSALLNKYIVRDMPDVDALRAEVDKADERALSRSAMSFSGLNLALELKRLTTPALLLHGEDDDFIQPPSEELLRRINAGKPAGYFLTLIEPTLRHFPMLETTAKFNRLLLDFLEAPDLSNVQFKDQWKRTMR